MFGVNRFLIYIFHYIVMFIDVFIHTSYITSMIKTSLKLLKDMNNLTYFHSLPIHVLLLLLYD
jgi:hypothetical protein